MYNLFAEHLQINQIIQDWFTSNLVANRFWRDLLIDDWIQSLDPKAVQKTWNANQSSLST